MKRFYLLPVLLIIAMSISTGCSKEESTNTGPESPGEVDHSGRYYVTFGAEPRWILDIAQVDSSASFYIRGSVIDLSGTGRFKGDSLYLSADLGENGTFVGELLFSRNGESFTGLWHFEGGALMHGTMTGSRNYWEIHDLDEGDTPRFATENCIELDKISRISRFRSGEGHDYSDDFETCRSMKHYYLAKSGVDNHTVKLFSPVNGTIIGMVDEYDGSLWKGTQIGIRPDGFSSFVVIIFHINLTDTLTVGDHVTAGQELGTSQKQDGTATDVAVGVHVPGGYKLISFFEIITDDVFQLYQARGVSSRSEFIITKEERDGDPLECTGQEQFVDRGNIENWVHLSETTEF